MDQDAIVRQLDDVIRRYEEARKTSKYSGLSDLPDGSQMELFTSMAAAIDRLAPSKTPYLQNALDAIEIHHDEDEELSDTVHTLAGILRALKSDYEAGYLQLIQELIHADIFADIFEMAEYLLEQGFKDPAAVLIGGVLEEHLRKLCNKTSIPITIKDRPKKADSMNSELAGLKIYGKLEQKCVTAWLDLRNKAAHGKYNEYTNDQVKVMLMGTRDFVSRFPA